MDLATHISASMIYSFIGGVTVGSIGTLLSVRIVSNKRITGKNAVDQSGATAGGDVVGRDKRGS